MVLAKITSAQHEEPKFESQHRRGLPCCMSCREFMRIPFWTRGLLSLSLAREPYLMVVEQILIVHGPTYRAPEGGGLAVLARPARHGVLLQAQG